MQKIDTALKKIEGFDIQLKKSMQKELLFLKKINPSIRAEVFSEGFAIYSLGSSDLVISTIHNGSQVPKGIKLKQTKKARNIEEDLYTLQLYLPLFLEFGGYLITSHISRYYLDLNRSLENSILVYEAPDKTTNLKEGQNEKKIRNDAIRFHKKFYSEISKVVKSSSYIFNGHSLGNRNNRGEFYLMCDDEKNSLIIKKNLEEKGFEDIIIDDPSPNDQSYFRDYTNNIVKGKSIDFETNKRLYMDEKSFKKTKSFKENSKKICAALILYYKEKINI